jgi:hypothetical protein
MQSCSQAAVSFRDAGLFSVFQLALAALRQLTAPGQQADFKLQEQVRSSNHHGYTLRLHCVQPACCGLGQLVAVHLAPCDVIRMDAFAGLCRPD